MRFKPLALILAVMLTALLFGIGIYFEGMGDIRKNEKLNSEIAELKSTITQLQIRIDSLVAEKEILFRQRNELQDKIEKQVDIKEPELTEPITQVIYEDGWKITAYCACEICCGQWAATNKNRSPVGASGTVLTPGVSAANNSLPFGTKISIKGYGTVIIEDRSAGWVNQKYNGKYLDIYMSSHEEALKMGGSLREVYINDGKSI